MSGQQSICADRLITQVLSENEIEKALMSGTRFPAIAIQWPRVQAHLGRSHGDAQSLIHSASVSSHKKQFA
ncbi:hypothetical protein MY5147_004054 [Beauveria neobassiana]|uniref:Uncharacterized protein n=1 Tax=Beauveria bassiana TaxID=176275 RepID=A0A2N6NJV4_BEABA|nr:hypothetical protein BM221_007217 [Beauveria bassiana]